MGVLSKIATTIIIVLGTVIGFKNTEEPSITNTENQIEMSTSEETEIVVEEEPEVMASGDNDYPDYLDEEAAKREEYDNRSLDELLDQFEEEFNREVDKAIEEALYESLDPYEQFIYGLQYSLGSYVDSVYNQYYSDPTRTASSINAELELSNYFTDLYDYENIVTDEDLIKSIENSKFRNVSDKTIGDAIYGNLEDVEYYIKENPVDPETRLVRFVGIDSEYDVKYSITFEVFDLCIGVHSVSCNNRSVGGIEDVLEVVQYILR